MTKLVQFVHISGQMFGECAEMPKHACNQLVNQLSYYKKESDFMRNKEQKQERYLRESTRGNKRYYSELKSKAKRANQRLVRLEQLEIESPAYQAVQAKLEILGKQKNGNRGRRFSESGKATYNEYEILNKILDDFLNLETSTTKGATQWVEDVWQGALNSDKGLFIKEAGITKEQWLDFWSNMPADKKSRMFASEQIVKMLRSYTYQNRELKDNDKMSMEEIAEAINSAESVKAGYEALGLSYKEVSETTKELGALHDSNKSKNNKRG